MTLIDPRDRNEDGVISNVEKADIDLDGAVSILDLAFVANQFLQDVPDPPITPTALTELLIAERGDNLLEHEIALPANLTYPTGVHDGGPANYDWGEVALESNKTGYGSINLWIVAERDIAQIAANLNARVAIKSCQMRVLIGSTWYVAMNGSPGFGTFQESSDVQTAGSYSHLTPTLEIDSAYSYYIPPYRAIHCSQNSPGYVIPQGTPYSAVACVIEAKLVGVDAGICNWGINVGADLKDTNGECATSICEPVGIGHFGQLTTSYKQFTMLCSTLTDNQIRANQPSFS